MLFYKSEDGSRLYMDHDDSGSARTSVTDYKCKLMKDDECRDVLGLPLTMIGKKFYRGLDGDCNFSPSSIAWIRIMEVLRKLIAESGEQIEHEVE